MTQLNWQWFFLCLKHWDTCEIQEKDDDMRRTCDTCFLSDASVCLYGEASRNSKLMIILCSDPLLCIISTGQDSDSNKFVRYSLKVLHHGTTVVIVVFFFFANFLVELILLGFCKTVWLCRNAHYVRCKFVLSVFLAHSVWNECLCVFVLLHSLSLKLLSKLD